MSPKEYAQLVYEVAAEKNDDERVKILERFKVLLIRRRDTHLASAIVSAYDALQREGKQRGTTYITSAAKLSPAQRKELEALFPEPRSFSVNPTLLGGTAVRAKDTLYNATMKKKVEMLKSQL